MTKKHYYIQRGENPDWPNRVLDSWKIGELIPEWLSDKAHVTIITGDGIKNIETRETSTGGIEIVDSGKIGILVTLKKRDWLVIYDGVNIKSIGPEQFEILYKMIIKK